MFAPGGTVGRVSSTTRKIKELKNEEMRVRNSDIAKLAAKEERSTTQAHYEDR